MEVVRDLPPNWETLREAFPQADPMRVVVTYGQTLYNPGGGHIDRHLMVHEETHARQQGENPDEWYARYLTDSAFRVEQEAEAYARQFRSYSTQERNRERQALFLRKLAGDLSGPTYGNCISIQEAQRLIRAKV